jgi:predicted flap endonuclease-1-like 5' DNA nuclease
MFDLNPLENPNAWWQHVLMLVIAGVIGYIIGYRSRRVLIVELEDELAGLDSQLDECQRTTIPAPVVAPIAAITLEEEKHASLTVTEIPIVLAPEPMDTIIVPAVDLPVVPPKHDNLKLVEGIGPKIEELLNKEGIVTFRDLSEASFERLTDILRAAGTRFQMHDPESWPQQAEMAADGRWDELKAWQDEMNKGRIS